MQHLLTRIPELVGAGLATGYLSWIILEDGRPLRFDIWYTIRNAFHCTKHQIRIWRKQYNKVEVFRMQRCSPEFPNGIPPTADWYEVSYQWRKVICHLEMPYRHIKLFIRNLIYYTPFLWIDSWWDHTFLLYILERKCRRDSQQFREHGCAEESKKIADELQDIADICHRLQHEYEAYDEKRYDDHDKKWGESPDFLGNRSRPNASTTELKEQERKEFRQLTTDAENEKQKDCVFLGFLFMRIRNWWD